MFVVLVNSSAVGNYSVLSQSRQLGSSFLDGDTTSFLPYLMEDGLDHKPECRRRERVLPGCNPNKYNPLLEQSVAGKYCNTVDNWWVIEILPVLSGFHY